MDDLEIMKIALLEAKKALKRGECPVGAVIVKDGKIIAKAGNRESELNDPTAHAEILVLREAGKLLKKHTFPECVIYTTLWPCPMCANSMIRAKIKKVVSGAKSFNYIMKETFNPDNLIYHGPILENDCRDVFIKWIKDTGREFILKEEV